MRLTIITCVLRPAMALEAARSVQAAHPHPWELEHRLRYWQGEPDYDRRRTGPWVTSILREISAGWVLFVDDDNRLHPNLPARLAEVLAANPDARAVAFDCAYPEFGGVLTVEPRKVAPLSIDGAQVAFRHDHGLDWPDGPTADGQFYARLHQRDPGAWVFVNEVLTYHNHQVWGSV